MKFVWRRDHGFSLHVEPRLVAVLVMPFVAYIAPDAISAITILFRALVG